MDRYANTNVEYYQRLKEGTASNKDFERYLYGAGTQKLKDERDIIEEKERQEIRKIGRNL